MKNGPELRRRHPSDGLAASTPFLMTTRNRRSPRASREAALTEFGMQRSSRLVGIWRRENLGPCRGYSDERRARPIRPGERFLQLNSARRRAELASLTLAWTSERDEDGYVRPDIGGMPLTTAPSQTRLRNAETATSHRLMEGRPADSRTEPAVFAGLTPGGRACDLLGLPCPPSSPRPGGARPHRDGQNRVIFRSQETPLMRRNSSTPSNTNPPPMFDLGQIWICPPGSVVLSL